MAASFVPTLVLYGRAPLWAFALPLAGALYAAMTLDSARRYLRGGGNTWKGRTVEQGAGVDSSTALGEGTIDEFNPSPCSTEERRKRGCRD
jgi:hypothetical protein